MPEPSAPPIKTEGLSKTYGTRNPVKALAPLTLTVEPGAAFGLLGPNGAGKTTLVKLLLGLAQPTTGEASIFGVSVRDAAARRPVGYLPEGHRFPPFLTGREVLDVLARMAGVSASDRASRAPDLLERVRLADAANRRVSGYSKGMLQRLGIAQALMNRPRLILLDEPTDGVDPVGRREIRDLIAALRDEGVTVFLNSHLLSEVERVCSRVAILNKGVMVRDGTVDELTLTGRAWRLRTTALGDETIARFGGALALDESAVAGDLTASLLTVPDRPALNAVLDSLRADGVEVEAVEPLRQSLEDLFVQVVESDSSRSQ